MKRGWKGWDEMGRERGGEGRDRGIRSVRRGGSATGEGKDR